MNDLISRQAAIDAVNGLIDRFEQILRDIREANGDDSVCGMCEYDGAYIGQSGDWCNECPGFDKEDCFKLSDKCRKRWLKSVELPPTEPKRIRGKWLYCEDSMANSVDGYRCDQCGFFVPWDYKHKGIDFIQDYNFCPNCGADMRGEPMDDLISRQAAIDALDAKITVTGRENAEAVRRYVTLIVDRIVNFPSAQPEIVRCKDCKHWIPYDWMFSEVWQSKNIADYPEDEIGCDCCDMAMKANDFCSRGERRTDG